MLGDIEIAELIKSHSKDNILHPACKTLLASVLEIVKLSEVVFGLFFHI